MKDLPVAVAGNQKDGSADQAKAFAAVQNQVFPSIVSKAQVVQTPAAVDGNAAAPAATPTAAATNNGKGAANGKGATNNGKGAANAKSGKGN